MRVEDRCGRRARMELFLAPVATGVLSGVVGAWPTYVLGGWAGVKTMLLALVILMAVLCKTLLPVRRKMALANETRRLRIALGVAGQRFVVILAVAVAASWFEWANRERFLVWLAIGYVTLTLAETIALVRWMRKTETRACT